MDKAFFCCPGNGGQHQIYYEKNILDTPENQASLEKLNEVAGHDLAGMMLDKEGRLKLIDETDIQLSIVACGIMAGNALKKKVSCSGTIGLSLGEVTAGCLAGCFDEDTAYHIISNRAKFMQECVPARDAYPIEPNDPDHYMCAINHAPLRFILKRCKHTNKRNEKNGYVTVANEFTPSQTIVSGTAAAVNRAIRGIKREYESAKFISLRTEGPWHNRFYMAKAKEKLIELLDDIPFHAPVIPFYMMARNRFEKDPGQIKENYAEMLVRHMKTWYDIRRIHKAGYSPFIDIGPGRVFDTVFNNIYVDSVNRAKVLEERVAPVKSTVLV